MSRYRELFRQPHFLGIGIAGFIGRLPDIMIGIALLLAFAEHTSFGKAGLAAGAYALAAGASAPARGRIVDRRGARLPLVVLGVTQPLLLVALVAMIGDDTGTGVLLVICALVGATTPGINSVQRTVWTRWLPTEQLRNSAFALDSVVGEGVYISGTLLVGAFTATDGPELALLACAGLRFAGTMGIVASPALNDWKVSRERVHWLGPLVSSEIRALLAIMLLGYSAFGALDVAVAASATEHGDPAATGLLLGALGIGSVFGGLVQGSRDWPSPLPRQHRRLLLAMALGLVPLLISPGLFTLGLLLLVAGAVVAPVSTVQFNLARVLAPAGTLTESFAWVTAALTAGIAVGSAVAGPVVESASLTTVFAIPLAFAAAAALVSLTPAAGRAPRPQVEPGPRPSSTGLVP